MPPTDDPTSLPTLAARIAALDDAIEAIPVLAFALGLTVVLGFAALCARLAVL